MSKLFYIDGAIIASNKVPKYWDKIVQSVNANHKPIFVYKNNKPQVVVLSVDGYINMQKIIEATRREQ